MSKFSEETYQSWQRAASESEEQRISNAISMVKDAFNSFDSIKDKSKEIFVQGSYANDTNVRANSDVDICVMLKSTFYDIYPVGKDREHYGFSSGTYDFKTFRSDLIKALNNKYGSENVKPGNKSIKIIGNSYRVETDVVPSFQYRNYRHNYSVDPNTFVEGIKLYAANTGEEVINYPKLHIENGKQKNSVTQKRYKRLVRIIKRIRYKMIDDGIPVNKGISSFLIECLIWNIPNSYFNDYHTWTDRVKQSIVYLYNLTNSEYKCNNLKEVSGMLDLFSDDRKWNVKMVNEFMIQIWNYIGFK